MSQHIKDVAKVPSDLHPYAVDPLGKGKAITDAALALEAVHVGMNAIFTAEANIADKQKLHPHMLETSQNILRNAGSAAKRIDDHISTLAKKIDDTLKLTPEEAKYAAQVIDYLGKQNSPVTLAMAESQRGNHLMAKVLLDAPHFLVGTKGIDPDKKTAVRDVLLQSAVPDLHNEYESALKAKAKIAYGIDYVIKETAKRNSAWAGHVSHVDDLKNVKLVGKFNKVADEVSP
jgi:hypothetical protein